MVKARYSQAVELMHTGSVVVAGGYGGGQFLAAAEPYNPSTGTWTNRAAMTQGRSGATATRGPNGAIVVIGGYSGTTFFASTESFNPTAMTWSTGSALVQRRGSHRTVAFEGVFLSCRGAKGETGKASHRRRLDKASESELTSHNRPVGTWIHVPSWTSTGVRHQPPTTNSIAQQPSITFTSPTRVIPWQAVRPSMSARSSIGPPKPCRRRTRSYNSFDSSTWQSNACQSVLHTSVHVTGGELGACIDGTDVSRIR